MIHHNKTKKLSRGRSHRKALVKNLSRSLFLHGKIITTKPKASVLIPYVCRFITTLIKKENKLNAIRFIKSRINNEDRRVIEKITMFYINSKDNIKSNYIAKKHIFNNRLDSAKTMQVLLINN